MGWQNHGRSGFKLHLNKQPKIIATNTCELDLLEVIPHMIVWWRVQGVGSERVQAAEIGAAATPNGRSCTRALQSPHGAWLDFLDMMSHISLAYGFYAGL